jgi:NAD-reducing hydrogenase large subunit
VGAPRRPLRFTDSRAHVVADQVEPSALPRLHRRGRAGILVPEGAVLQVARAFPGGIYRVGPLARLNICERMGVPRADAELRAFRRWGGPVTSSFLYHHARLIEIVAALEYIERALEDPELSSGDLRADAGVNALRGVGASEAPRGTLFHDYTVDRSASSGR